MESPFLPSATTARPRPRLCRSLPRLLLNCQAYQALHTASCWHLTSHPAVCHCWAPSVASRGVGLLAPGPTLASQLSVVLPALHGVDQYAGPVQPEQLLAGYATVLPELSEVLQHGGTSVRRTRTEKDELTEVTHDMENILTDFQGLVSSAPREDRDDGR